ncbi:hypothetical protein WI96_20755 [Burkholderia vietnamiensis]|nr:hypothetical protein WI96_20755 [Burkholderia vietnamiensis]
MLTDPSHFWVAPLEAMDETERAEFEGLTPKDAPEFTFWPEVGSRMMTRLLTGQDLDGPWVIVQDGVYRYSILQQGLFRVRIVIHEYLAAEVTWDD